MAMTLSEVQTLLDETGIKYRVHDESSVALTWRTEHYRNAEGRAVVLVFVKLDLEGSYLKVFMPGAFTARGPHVDALLRACMILQWRTLLVQFEYDETDGEIRPIVEFPLEDAKLTSKQLGRCVRALVYLVDEYYPTLRRALDEGVFALPGPSPPPLPKGPARLIAEQLVASLKEEGLSDDDPTVALARRLLEDVARKHGPPADGPPTEA
jgi:hypothetical protein